MAKVFVLLSLSLLPARILPTQQSWKIFVDKHLICLRYTNVIDTKFYFVSPTTLFFFGFFVFLLFSLQFFFWFKHLSVLLLLLLQYMKSIEKYITKNRLRQHIHTKQLSEFCNLSQSNCRFVDSSSVLTVAIIGKTLTMCPQFMCVTKFFRYLFVFGMRLTLKRVANLLNLRYWPNIIVGCCQSKAYLQVACRQN